MKIANIYPIKNQEMYKYEQFVMILAHLVKKGLYSPEYFNNNQYIIMDNGLYEKEQVSTNLIDCIKIAEESGLPVKEIIIPDAVNDLQETIRLFENSIDTIKSWQHKYSFMFVAQAKTYEELSEAFDYINSYVGQLKLTIGVSKLTPLERDNPIAKLTYQQSLFPIHFLGLKSSFKELKYVSKLIRSCDTSQLAFIAKNVINSYDCDVFNYERVGVDIDLLNDKCDKLYITHTYAKELEDLRYNGIL